MQRLMVSGDGDLSSCCSDFPVVICCVKVSGGDVVLARGSLLLDSKVLVNCEIRDSLE